MRPVMNWKVLNERMYLIKGGGGFRVRVNVKVKVSVRVRVRVRVRCTFSTVRARARASAMHRLRMYRTSWLSSVRSMRRKSRMKTSTLIPKTGHTCSY